MEDKLKDKMIGNELEKILMEATQSVEDELKMEDAGWTNLSSSGSVISAADKITNLKLSRLYAAKDPLAHQAIRLWTDYTFGTGMTWTAKDDQTKDVMEKFWDCKCNRRILGAAGQRKSSNKLLTDGMIYYAIFLGPDEAPIRRIDPLEITEIITAIGDKENEMFYRRNWADNQGASHSAIYRSTDNIKNESAVDMHGKTVQKTEDALIYHLEYNDSNPLLLPALDWIKQYRRFLASRIAIMLALARFAWRTKVKGGQTAVDAIKAKTNEKEIAAGSQLLENMGSDTMPIKTESGAANAYQDGRQIKLQICAAVGIPEQYFGDISIGNLATAKTVELPMLKMFQSYQAVWADAYKDINEVILEHYNVPEDKWYIDMDFPKVAPEDVLAVATALVQILQAMPDLAYADDVKQIALLTLGINDPQEVLDNLATESIGNTDVKLIKAIQQLKEAIKERK